MTKREIAAELIRKGKIWKDPEGGLHIGAFLDLTDGECWEVGEYLDIIKAMAPERPGHSAK